MAKKTITIELFTAKGKGKQVHRFRVRAGNGEVIHISEGYSTRSNSKRAAKEFETAAGPKNTTWVDLFHHTKKRK